MKTYTKPLNLKERNKKSKDKKGKEVNENKVHCIHKNLSSEHIKIQSIPKQKQIETNQIKPLKLSIHNPKKTFKELYSDESLRLKTRRMTLNDIKFDISQSNHVFKNLTSKHLTYGSRKNKNMSTKKVSKKFIVSYDDDSEIDENKSNFEERTLKQRKFRKSASLTPRKKNTTLLKTSKKASKSSTKRLSHLNLINTLSPSIQHRIANIDKPRSLLQEVQLKLHVSVVPKSLPCREEEFNNIYTYLHARLSDNSGGCIYISGVPGTGKTATVNEVIRCLKKSVNNGKLIKFDFISINGMKLSEPRQAYVQICKQLTGETLTWEAAYKLLQNRFTKSNSKHNMALLLIDELDLLCTKRQDVVYNLLEWPSRSDAKLVVVTIANTMDLPERILISRVTSRLGLTRLTFPPYNHKQLEQIVLCRLQGYNSFNGETIQLVARKVASVSGDARRALDICRRSAEVAEMNGHKMVSMIDVKKALDEMIANPKIQAIKYCSDLEKIFLKAVCAEIHRTGVEEVLFKNVYFQLQTLCTFNGEKVPNVTEALSMCARLGSWRLLLCDHSKMDIHQRLLLNVTTDDVHFAVEPAEA